MADVISPINDLLADIDPDQRAPLDAKRVEQAVREILLAIGEDPDRDGLVGTPDRVARSYQEIFAGLYQRPEEILATTFDIGHDEFVVVKDIIVHSTCEHHLMPFMGVAHVGYVPNETGRVTGISKLARLVDVFAKRPQVQERMTAQVADSLMRILQPKGAIVVVDCEHTCMTLRGVLKPGAKTVTSAARGSLAGGADRAAALATIFQR